MVPSTGCSVNASVVIAVSLSATVFLPKVDGVRELRSLRKKTIAQSFCPDLYGMELIVGWEKSKEFVGGLGGIFCDAVDLEHTAHLINV